MGHLIFWMWSIWLRMLCVSVSLISLSACGQTGEWDEEVRLANGEILRVHRTQRWTTTQPAGEGKSYISKQGILEIEPSTKGSPDKPWKGDGELLMVVDIDSSNGEYFIISVPKQCWRWDELGRPNPPYVEYRFRDRLWQRVSWTGMAVGRKPNLWVMPIPTAMKKKMTEDDIAWQVRLPKPLKSVLASGPLPNC